jgi:hypothetical protein
MSTYDPALAQRRFRTFKTTLTRRLTIARRQQTEAAWRAVLDAVRAFADYYRNSAEPMPDFWHTWLRAGDDAVFALRRLGVSVTPVEFA